MGRVLGVALMAAVLAACGGSSDSAASTTCDPGNCAGCCYSGACQVGSANAACGSGGGTCSVCGAHQICLPAQACGLDPAQQWYVLLVSATVKPTNNGAAWDGNGTPPDPYGWFPDASFTTSTKLDTYTASWSPGEGISAPASFLTGSGFQFQLFDDDSPLSPDPISQLYVIHLVDANFAAGTYTMGPVDGAQSITFSIAKH